MRRLFDYLMDNGTELMFGVALFLAIYLIARLLKAGPLAAACYGFLPLGLLYLTFHPNTHLLVLSMMR